MTSFCTGAGIRGHCTEGHPRRPQRTWAGGEGAGRATRAEERQGPGGQGLSPKAGSGPGGQAPGFWRGRPILGPLTKLTCLSPRNQLHAP